MVLAVVSGVGLSPSAAAAAEHQGHEHDDSCMMEVHGTVARQSASGAAVVVYLNGRGAEIRAGYEDASLNRSSVVHGRGVASVNVPRYSRGTARWNAVVGCVRDQFSAFNVTITDRRPAAGTYVMMAVGGHPSMLGLGRFVGGIAPYNGDVIDGAVGFVFERAAVDRRGLGLRAVELCRPLLAVDRDLERVAAARDLERFGHGVGVGQPLSSQLADEDVQRIADLVDRRVTGVELGLPADESAAQEHPDREPVCGKCAAGLVSAITLCACRS